MVSDSDSIFDQPPPAADNPSQGAQQPRKPGLAGSMFASPPPSPQDGTLVNSMFGQPAPAPGAALEQSMFGQPPAPPPSPVSADQADAMAEALGRISLPNKDGMARAIAKIQDAARQQQDDATASIRGTPAQPSLDGFADTMTYGAEQDAQRLRAMYGLPTQQQQQANPASLVPDLPGYPDYQPPAAQPQPQNLLGVPSPSDASQSMSVDEYKDALNSAKIGTPHYQYLAQNAAQILNVDPRDAGTVGRVLSIADPVMAAIKTREMQDQGGVDLSAAMQSPLARFNTTGSSRNIEEYQKPSVPGWAEAAQEALLQEEQRTDRQIAQEAVNALQQSSVAAFDVAEKMLDDVSPRKEGETTGQHLVRVAGLLNVEPDAVIAGIEAARFQINSEMSSLARGDADNDVDQSERPSLERHGMVESGLRGINRGTLRFIEGGATMMGAEAGPALLRAAIRDEGIKPSEANEQSTWVGFFTGDSSLRNLPDKLAGLVGEEAPAMVSGGAIGRAAFVGGKSLGLTDKLAKVGAMGASSGVMAPREFGAQYQEAYVGWRLQGLNEKEARGNALVEAGLYSIAAGALDAAPLAKLFPTGKVKPIMDSGIVRNTIKRGVMVLTQTGQEGVLEGLQSLSSQLAGVIAGRAGIDDVDAMQVLEETIAGAALGGSMGVGMAASATVQEAGVKAAIGREMALQDRAGYLEQQMKLTGQVQEATAQTLNKGADGRTMGEEGGLLNTAETLDSEGNRQDGTAQTTDDTRSVGAGRGRSVRPRLSRDEESGAVERLEADIRSQAPGLRVRIGRADPRSADDRALFDIASDYGRDVVFFERLDSDDPLPVVGATDTTNPNILLIESGSAIRGANGVLHHELLGHSVAERNPELWNELEAALQREAPMLLKRMRERYAQTAQDNQVVINLATLPQDAVGDLAMDLSSDIYGPMTRQALARIAVSNGPTFIDRTLDYIDNVIRRVIGKAPASTSRASRKIRNQEKAKATLLFRDALIKEAEDQGVLSRTSRRLMTAEQFPDLYRDVFAEDARPEAISEMDAEAQEADGAGQAQPDNEMDEPSTPPTDMSVGDTVQWSSGGVDQFDTPRAITAITPDGRWAQVEGSDTFVPTQELTPQPQEPNDAQQEPQQDQVDQDPEQELPGDQADENQPGQDPGPQVLNPPQTPAQPETQTDPGDQDSDVATQDPEAATVKDSLATEDSQDASRADAATQGIDPQRVGPAMKRDVSTDKRIRYQSMQTITGREITPPHHATPLDTDRKANAYNKNLQKWLVREAINEAESRGDELNAMRFRDERPPAARGQLPPASVDVLNSYLFGRSQPDEDINMQWADLAGERMLRPMVAEPASIQTGDASAEPAQSTDAEITRQDLTIVDGRLASTSARRNPLGLVDIPKTLTADDPLLQETLGKTEAVVTEQSRIAQEGILAPGTYTRDELHARLLDYFASQAITEEQPRVIFTGGGSGAGKSTLVNYVKERGRIPEDLLELNADEFKVLLPEYDAIVAAGDGRAAMTVHEESSMLAKRLMAKMLDERKTFIFDATLANPSKSLSLMADVKQRGYTVELLAVTVDPYEAAVRSSKRAVRSGRYVPNSFVLDAHKGFHAGLQAYIDASDSVILVENTRDDAVVTLLTKDADSGVQVLNETLYKRIMDRKRLDANAETREKLIASYPVVVPSDQDVIEHEARVAEELDRRDQDQQSRLEESSEEDAGTGTEERDASAPAVAERRSDVSESPDGEIGIDTDDSSVRSNDQGDGESGLAGSSRAHQAGARSDREALQDSDQTAVTRREPRRGIDGGDSRSAQRPGVKNSAAGRRDDRAGDESGSDGRDSASDAEAARAEPAGSDPGLVSRPARESHRRNHTIAPDEAVAPTTNKRRYDANIEALLLLAELQQERRDATAEEKRTLAKYTGFGWANFENKEGKKMMSRLEGLLTEEQIASVKRSTLNAHFTRTDVILEMWNMVERLGFKGGTVLEPAAGVGHFIGAMPEHLADRSISKLIEQDIVTGQIASKLYPESDVSIDGFQFVPINNSTVDLAISNIPFGGFKARGAKDYPNYLIHDYFFARSLDKVKPGGLVAFITSEGTLNKLDKKARKDIASRSDLVAAVRLPGGRKGAFAGNAGTEVTTDIIILRKHSTKPWKGAKDVPDWIDTIEIGKDPQNDAPIVINNYFAARPEHALGTHSMQGTMRSGRPDYQLDPNLDTPLEEQLSAVIDTLPEGVMSPESVLDADNVGKEAPTWATELSHIEQDGDWYQVIAGSLQPAPWLTQRNYGNKWDKAISAADVEKRKAYAKLFMDLADARDAVINAEIGGAGKKELSEHRRRLNKTYASAVDQVKTGSYKSLNRPSGKSHNAPFAFLEEDPRYYKVLSLEREVEYTDKKSGKTKYKYEKQAIFDKQTVAAVQRPVSAGTPGEAISINLNFDGRIDPDTIADLLGTDSATATQRMRETGQAFLDPSSGTWMPRSAYLSGPVVRRLRAAEAAVAEGQDEFQTNVDALLTVQPDRIPLGDVQLRLSSRWLPGPALSAWASETFNGKVSVRYIKEANTYQVVGSVGSGAQEQYGTDRVDVLKLFEKALEGRQHKVTDNIGTSSEPQIVVNKQATEDAARAMRNMERHFEQWAKTTTAEVTVDGQRQSVVGLIEDAYNETNNAVAETVYDGSHMTFPGLSDDVWQKDYRTRAVARVMQDGGAVLAHGVGSGKTLTMIMSAYELKRTGLRNKSLIVVKKPTVTDFASAVQMAYPTAQSLVSTDKSFSKGHRQRFMNQIAVGDWDMVIITQEQFTMLAMGEQAIQRYFQWQIADLEIAIRESKAIEGKSASTKQIERAKEAMETKQARMLDDLSKRQDKGLTWEELGVDQVFIDEAHDFKKIPINSRKENIKGVPNDTSQRALHLDMVTQYTQSRGGGVVLATGTPITNTVAEAFVMLKLARPDVLNEYNIYNFDDFANTFGEAVEAMEYTYAMKFKFVTRFNRLVNIPELTQMIRQGFDVAIGNEKLGLDVPKIRGGAPQVTEYEITPALEKANEKVVEAVSRFENLEPSERRENSWVPIVSMGYGTAAALDPRLVDANAADDPGSKVNRAIGEMVRIYKTTNKSKGTQIVFADRYHTMNTVKLDEFIGGSAVIRDEDLDDASVSDEKQEALSEEAEAERNAVGNFNLYEDIREKLVAAGVPRKEIALIGEANTDNQREKLFEAVNAGRVRIVIGSTEKLGVGVNVQKKLTALHALDPPRDMTPAKVEQRLGRIIRQGHEDGHPSAKEVEVFYYGVAKSMDAGVWQKIEQKGRFIDAMLSGNVGTRTMEDLSGATTNSAAEFFAKLTGDPRALEALDLDHRIKKMRDDKAGFDAEVTKAVKAHHEVAYEIEHERKKHQELQSVRPDVVERYSPLAEYKNALDRRLRTLAEKHAPTRGKTHERMVAAMNRHGLPGSIEKEKVTGRDGTDYNAYVWRRKGERPLPLGTNLNNAEERLNRYAAENPLPPLKGAPDFMLTIAGKAYTSFEDAAAAVFETVERNRDVEKNTAVNIDLDGGYRLRLTSHGGTRTKADGILLHPEGEPVSGVSKPVYSGEDLLSGIVLAAPDKIDNRIAAKQEAIEDGLKKLEALESRIQTPWDQTREYELAIKRLDRLKREMAGTDEKPGIALLLENLERNPIPALSPPRMPPRGMFSLRRMDDGDLIRGRGAPKSARLPAYGPSVPGSIGFKPGRPANFTKDQPEAETPRARKLIKRITADNKGDRYGMLSIVSHLADALGVRTRFGREQTTQTRPGSYLPGARLLRSRGSNWQADLYNMGFAVFEDAQAMGADWIKALAPRFKEIGDYPGSFAADRHNPNGVPIDQGFAEWFRRFVWDPQSNPAEVTNRIMAWMDANTPDTAKAMRDTHRAVTAHVTRSPAAQLKSHQSDKPDRVSGVQQAFDWMQDATFRAFSSEAAIDFKVLRPVFKNVRKGAGLDEARSLMARTEDTPADVRNASQWMNALPDELTAAIAADKKSPHRGLRVVQTSSESLGDLIDAVDDETTRSKLIQQFKIKAADTRNPGFGNVLRLTSYTFRDIVEAVNQDPKTKENADLWADFENYGFAKTALDRWEKAQHPYPGLSEGLEPPQLMRMVADYERYNPHFKAQYRRINDYMDRMLLISFMSGEFTADELLRIQGKYEAYWPLPRDTGLQNNVSGAAGDSDSVNPSAGVMRAHGGAEPFLNIAQAVERRTRQALQAYYQNATMKSVLHMQEQVRGISDLSAEQRAEVMRMVTPLQLDWRKVAELDPTEKAAAVAEYMNQGLVEGDEKVRPEDIAILEPGQAIGVWRQQAPNAVRVIGVNISGDRRYYQIDDPTLFEYFARATEPIKMLRHIAQFIGAVNRERQQVLTQNLSFAGRSLFRDMPSAMLFGETNHKYIPLAYLGLGIANRLTGKYPQATTAVGELWSSAQIEADRKERRLARLNWQEVYENAIEVEGWDQMSIGRRVGSVAKKIARAPLSMADTANWLSKGWILPGWANMDMADKIKAVPAELFRLLMAPAHGVNYITGGRFVSNLMERLPREGQAVALIKAGYSPMRARAGAMRVTGNFSAKAGDTRVQDIHRFALFMNAWAQISYQTARGLAIEPDPIKKLSSWTAIATAAASIGGILPAIAYLMMSDEQRKLREEAKDEERLAFVWLPLPIAHGSEQNNQFIRLPHDYGPPGAATSFANYLVEQHLFDRGVDGEKAAEAVLKRALSLPSFIDLITPDVRTLIELQLNRSFFFGGEIVPSWMEREFEELPESQAFPDQRAWETWLARQMGVSPIKLRYALGQHFTRQSLDILDNVERLANYLRGQNDPNPLDELQEIPVIGHLLAREPRAWRSQSVEDLADQATLSRSLLRLADSLESGPHANNADVQKRIIKLREDAESLGAQQGDRLAALQVVRQLWQQVKDERSQSNPDHERIRDLEREMRDIAREAYDLADESQ